MSSIACSIRFCSRMSFTLQRVPGTLSFPNRMCVSPERLALRVCPWSAGRQGLYIRENFLPDWSLSWLRVYLLPRPSLGHLWTISFTCFKPHNGRKTCLSARTLSRMIWIANGAFKLNLTCAKNWPVWHFWVLGILLEVQFRGVKLRTVTVE